MPDWVSTVLTMVFLIALIWIGGAVFIKAADIIDMRRAAAHAAARRRRAGG